LYQLTVMTAVFTDSPWHLAISGALLGLLLAFSMFFLIPGWSVGRQLRRSLKRLRAIKGAQDLGSVFERTRLQHVWLEFGETLHPEKALNPKTGVVEVLTLRATVPAEAFFTEDTIVNTPLHSEFFKHLPGILTGIGIIGTFSGLLLGLQGFQVTEDPGVAREGLAVLLRAVAGAFTISAAAITLAMLVTLAEKIVLVRLYKRLRQLTQALDERFRAGVGEEYLARLVGATEESASQSRILKDALVGDLKTILTEISENQIAAVSASNVRLSREIGDAVAKQLASPLERIASVTEGVRGDQSSAVQQLMADLLARFSDRLESLLGGQVAGMQQVQQQAIAALNEAVRHLQQMSATVEGAGQRASQGLMDKLEQTLTKLDQRQLVMNEEMRKFVHEIRAAVGQSQSESHQQLQALLSELARRTGALVGDLSDKSQSAVAAMSTQLDGLVIKVAEAVNQMSSSLIRMEGVTTDAIARMNSGAETLAVAADDFARAGAGVTGVMDQAQQVASQLTQSAQLLSSGSQAVGSLLGDYRATRDSVAQMLSSIQGTVDSARREASLTADILQRIEGAAGRLADAQTSADVYLQQVTQVLATSHEAFADAVKRTLDTGNREFLNGVSSATKMLREAIAELESALGGVMAPSLGRVR
jgi:hypothetical protein